MNVLIAVDSRHGSTMEIAHAVAAELDTRGVESTLLQAEDVRTVQGYDAVILGSAVYTGHWMRGARQLAVREREQLLQRPVWLFSSGPVGEPPFPMQPAIEVEEVQRLTRALSHRIFTGKLDTHELGPVEKVIVRAVKAKEGDYRNWDEIRTWADEIAAVLAPAVIQAG